MYSILNRDDLEKFKKLQETKSLLHEKRLKEKLGKQDLLLRSRRKLLKTRNKYLKTKFKHLKGNYKHYKILLKQQDRQ